jgi:hypothetical protein
VVWDATDPEAVVRIHEASPDGLHWRLTEEDVGAAP